MKISKYLFPLLLGCIVTAHCYGEEPLLNTVFKKSELTFSSNLTLNFGDIRPYTPGDFGGRITLATELLDLKKFNITSGTSCSFFSNLCFLNRPDIQAMWNIGYENGVWLQFPVKPNLWVRSETEAGILVHRVEATNVNNREIKDFFNAMVLRNTVCARGMISFTDWAFFYWNGGLELLVVFEPGKAYVESGLVGGVTIRREAIR